jgi:hypothetical protein
LIFSNVFETVIDPPIHHAKGFVEDQFDPVLEEAEGEIDQEVEAEMGNLGSHIWGVGDVMECL